jgi:hypothetical protein
VTATPPSLPRALLEQVIALLRFRGSPAEVPYSPRLLAGLIFASVVIDVAAAATLHIDGPVFARSLLSTLLVLVLCRVALAVRRSGSRFVQTATALVAC